MVNRSFLASAEIFSRTTVGVTTSTLTSKSRLSDSEIPASFMMVAPLVSSMSTMMSMSLCAWASPRATEPKSLGLVAPYLRKIAPIASLLSAMSFCSLSESALAVMFPSLRKVFFPG